MVEHEPDLPPIIADRGRLVYDRATKTIRSQLRALGEKDAAVVHCRDCSSGGTVDQDGTLTLDCPGVPRR